MIKIQLNSYLLCHSYRMTIDIYLSNFYASYVDKSANSQFGYQFSINNWMTIIACMGDDPVDHVIILNVLIKKLFGRDLQQTSIM